MISEISSLKNNLVKLGRESEEMIKTISCSSINWNNSSLSECEPDFDQTRKFLRSLNLRLNKLDKELAAENFQERLISHQFQLLEFLDMLAAYEKLLGSLSRNVPMSEKQNVLKDYDRSDLNDFRQEARAARAARERGTPRT